jgi:preprotein translocase subunit Sec61beta
VRQQAQAIYRKAGLDGRTDLAAYFLESVLGAPELDPKATVSSGIAVKAVKTVTGVKVAASRQHRFRGPAVLEPPVMPLIVADSG